MVKQFRIRNVIKPYAYTLVLSVNTLYTYIRSMHDEMKAER